ncbi:hypothetical protein FORC82_1194 [Escherichia coli]|nr:hypothetical protein FORC82_1194 [Escherichia coli]
MHETSWMIQYNVVDKIDQILTEFNCFIID